MGVPFLDLKAQLETVRADVVPAVLAVLESQHFVLGPVVEGFERDCATLCGTAEAIGTSSGTDALLLALMALGVGPGDEVITSPFTFFATAGAVARLGARPVFVDVEPGSFNLDAARIEARVTPRTRVLLPVHLFGQCADLDVVLDVARRRGLAVVEDAAQAIGAGYHGRPAGSMGDAGCLSFFPSKNLGAAGDAGMVVTGDAALAAKMRLLRNHGASPKYFHPVVGGNFRLDALQAAVLVAKLPHLQAWTEARRRNADAYRALLADVDGLVLPVELPGRRHVYNQFTVRIGAGRRDAVQAALRRAGVGTEVYYPLPLHLQACFADLGYRPGDLPEAEAAAAQVLSLPIYPELTRAQLEEVAGALREALA